MVNSMGLPKFKWQRITKPGSPESRFLMLVAFFIFFAVAIGLLGYLYWSTESMRYLIGLIAVALLALLTLPVAFMEFNKVTGRRGG